MIAEKSTILLFFLLYSLSGYAQPVLESIPPAFVEPCGPTYDYALKITNDSKRNLTDVTFSYKLPSGFMYEAKSARRSNNSIRELDISDLNHPVFRVLDIPPGIFVMEFKVNSTCEASENPSVLQDLVTFNYNNGNTIDYKGTLYNLSNPSIVISKVTNLDTTISVNGVFERTYTIFNNGFATFTQLFVEDEYDPGAIEIVSVEPGRFGNPERTLFIIDNDHFTGFGDRDRLFEPGEFIVFKERVRLLGCGDATSRLQFGWGCNNNICERSDQLRAFVQPNSDFPILAYEFQEEQYAGFCGNGRLEMTITNTATESVPGAASAFDLILDPIIDNFLDERGSCFQLENFLVNGQSVNINSSRGNGNQINFNQFLSNPDGPGGLEDLDNDGAFDDLAVGQSFTLSFDVFLLDECIQDVCNLEILKQDLIVESEFQSSCSRQRSSQQVRGKEHFYQLDIQASETDLQIEYFDKSSVDVVLFFEEGMAGFNESCANDSTIIKIELPDILKAPPGFAPRQNGSRVPFEINGSIISIFVEDYPGQLEMQLQANCDEVTAITRSLPCGGYTEDPDPLHQIIYWTEYYCDTKNCGSPQIIQCDTTRNFIIACPYEPGEVGFTDFELDVKRTTLGWTDHTRTQKVDPDDPDIKIRTAMSFDTVFFDYTSTIAGPGIFDTAWVRLSYYQEQYGELFRYLTDTLEFYDAETDQWIICSGVGIDREYTTELFEKRYEFSLFNLTKPGRCLDGINLTDGDKIRFRAYYVVTPSAPVLDLKIPDLRGKFVFNYLGEVWDCASIRTVLTVFSPTVGNLFDFSYSGEGCDTIELLAGFRQGRRGSGERDFFPFEYRSLIDWKNLSFEIPEWVDYIPGSSRYQYMYREDGEASGPILIETIPIPDPEYYVTDSLNYLYFDVDQLDFPSDYITESTETTIRFKVLPKCLSEENITLVQSTEHLQIAYSENSAKLVAEDEKRTINYQIGSRAFSSPNATFLGLTDTAAWNFNLSLRKGEARVAPNSWLYIDVEPNTVIPKILIEALPGGGTIRHELIPVGNNEDYWVKIGGLAKDSTRSFRLLADVEECKRTSFKVYTDFDCNGYPTDILSYIPNCVKTQPYIELKLVPQRANLLIRLEETPAPLTDLCAPLMYEFQGLVNELGGIFELEITMDILGTGMNIIPGSSSFKLNDTSYEPIGDPEQLPGTRTFVWKLGSLSARLDSTAPVNLFNLQFQLQLDCEYVHPSIFTYNSRWQDFCGNQDVTGDLVSPPVLILGLPSQTNNFLLEMEGLDYAACGGDNRLRVSLQNRGGAPGDLTNEFEFIRLVLPAGIDYVDGSFSGMHNISSENPQRNYVEGALRYIQWPMPLGVEKGDSIVFEVDLQAATNVELDCGPQPVQVHTAEFRGIPCSTAPGGFCNVAFRPTLDDFFITIDKPELQATYRSASASVLDADKELFTLGITLENTSTLLFEDELQLAYYFDVNDNQQYDPGVDELAGTRNLQVVLGPNESIDTLVQELEVPTESTCYGILLVIEPEQNSCICNVQSAYQGPVPLDNLPEERDTFCIGTVLPIGTTPQRGYTYNWTPATYIANPQSSLTEFEYTGTIPPGTTFSETLILTTTRSGGCVVQDSVEVSASYFEVELQVLDTVSCAGAATAALEAVVEGGAPSYQFDWGDDLPALGRQDSLRAGFYSLTVTDATGCISSASVDIQEPNPMQVTFQSSKYNGFSVSCFNGTDGRLSVEATGGVGPYSYQWDNGMRGSDLQGMAAGTYTVSVTDQNSCRLVDSINLDQPTPLEMQAAIQSISCAGAPDGSIQLNPTGGVGAYQYLWNTGQTSSSLEQLPAGRYELTLTDGNGCSIMETFEFEEPSALALQLQTTDIQCFNQDDGQIIAAVSGGTGAYRYQWENGSVQDTLRNLSAGSYQLTVFDSLGCRITERAVINQPDMLSIQLDVQAVNCYDAADGALLPQVSGGTAPYEFLWSDSSTTNALSNLAIGNYTVTVTDANGCTGEQSASIQQPEPLSLSIEAETISCFEAGNGSLSAVALGGTEPYNFNWSNGAAGNRIRDVGPDLYRVTVIDGNGCQLIDTINLSEPEPLELQLEAGLVSCFNAEDGSIRTQVNGGTGPYSFEWSTGSVADSISSLPPGRYSVVVTDKRGCTVQEELTLANPEPLQVNMNIQPMSCTEIVDGAIIAVASGGLSPYHYEWSTGNTGDSISGLPSGVYALTVTDELGCKVSSQEEIAVLPPIEISTRIDSVTCHDADDGFILASVRGGANEYEYLWNTGATTARINNLSPGAYRLTVTDVNGCIDSARVVLRRPEPLEISTFPEDISCFGETDGSIRTQVTGGNGTYQYQWSTGDNQSGIDQLTPGTYSLTVTDQKGCTLSVIDTLTPKIQLQVALSKQDPSCSGLNDGNLQAEILSGAGPFTYEWSTGSKDSVLQNLLEGAYTLTVTDRDGCTSEAGERITPPNPLELQTEKQAVSCFGLNDGALTASALGGTLPHRFEWNTGATTSELQALSTGIYSVTLTDSNGCTLSKTDTIEEPPLLDLSIAVQDISCNGAANGVLTPEVTGGVGNYRYQWSNGLTNSVISRLSPGRYGLEVTDDNGCTVNADAIITEPDLLGLQLTKKDMSCFDLADGEINGLVAGGTLPYTYQWSNGNSDDQISGLSSSTYSLTVTDGNGCTIVGTETIIQPPALSLIIDKEDIRCFGGVNGAVSGLVQGGTAPYQYQWNTGNTGETLSNLPAGNYELSVTDLQGCRISRSVELTQPDALVVQADVDTVSCFGRSDGGVALTVQGGIGPYDYSWNNGANTPVLNGLPANVYSVNVTDRHGCVEPLVITIPQPEALNLSSTVQNITCYEGTDGMIRLEVSGGSMPYSYQWNSGNSGKQLEGLLPGTYAVTVEDKNGCTVNSSHTITQPPPLVLETWVRDVACVGGSDGRIVIQGPLGEGFAYQLNGTGFQTDSIFKNLVEGVYQIVVKDINDCRAEAEVTVETVPRRLIFAQEDVTIKYGEQTTLEVIVDPSVIDPPLWSPVEHLSCTSCITTIAQPPISTGYAVQVINEGGCIDEDVIQVFVEEPRDHFIPTAFSPNDDGVNDRLIIFSRGDVTNIRYLQVFNRWGQMVFEQRDFQPNDLGEGWDGTFGGKPLNSGIYVVLAEIEFIDGAVRLEKGSVLLMR